MANDIFGAFSGLMGGLAKSGLVPKNTPEGKLFTAESELSELEKQEAEILTEIGRQAFEQEPDIWPQADKLKLIQRNIATAKAALEDAKKSQEEAEAAKAAEDAKGRCPECGHKNPEDVNFCQECGTKLGAAQKSFCNSCGAELAAGTRFCGACGAKQGE